MINLAHPFLNNHLEYQSKYPTFNISRYKMDKSALLFTTFSYWHKLITFLFFAVQHLSSSEHSGHVTLPVLTVTCSFSLLLF